jgi:hypothetical protein
MFVLCCCTGSDADVGVEAFWEPPWNFVFGWPFIFYVVEEEQEEELHDWGFLQILL